MIIALDCIGKLISYNYLIELNHEESPIENDDNNTNNDNNNNNNNNNNSNGNNSDNKQVKEKQNLIDRVIDTICDCFVGENTDDKVQLQIIKVFIIIIIIIDFIG
jgi:brefeldin A-inhibited guanine nucleotide-exchange protein